MMVDEVVRSPGAREQDHPEPALFIFDGACVERVLLSEMSNFRFNEQFMQDSLNNHLYQKFDSRNPKKKEDELTRDKARIIIDAHFPSDESVSSFHCLLSSLRRIK